jgi:hypothetical protein
MQSPAMPKEELIETVLSEEVPEWHRLIAAWCLSSMESRQIKSRSDQVTNEFAVFTQLKLPLFCIISLIGQRKRIRRCR